MEIRVCFAYCNSLVHDSIDEGGLGEVLAGTGSGAMRSFLEQLGMKPVH